MSFDARRYTIDGLTKQLLLLELHIRDGSVWECGCSWDAHLPLIEGLAEEGVKFAMNEEEKKFFDRLMHIARDARLKLQYGIEGEEGMEIEGEQSSNPIRKYTREEAKPWVSGRRYKYGCLYCKASYQDRFFLSQHVHVTHPKEWEKWRRKRDEYLELSKASGSSGSSNPVGITGESEKFIHETLQEKEVCDPRSFRTVARNEHRIVVCCPKGEWDESLPEGEQCRVGTIAQKILHPIWEKGEHAPEKR